MDIHTVDKHTFAFGGSLAIVSILSALLVVMKERSEPVMHWMKAATGHHWITHGLIVLVLFLVFGFMLGALAHASTLPGTPLGRGYNTLTLVIVVAVVLSGLMIAGFFWFA